MSKNNMSGPRDKSADRRPYALRLLGLVLLFGSVGLVSCQALWLL